MSTEKNLDINTSPKGGDIMHETLAAAAASPELFAAMMNEAVNRVIGRCGERMALAVMLYLSQIASAPKANKCGCDWFHTKGADLNPNNVMGVTFYCTQADGPLTTDQIIEQLIAAAQQAKGKRTAPSAN